MFPAYPFITNRTKFFFKLPILKNYFKKKDTMDPSPSRVRQIERESVDMDPLSMIFDTETTNAKKVNTVSQQQQQILRVPH